MIAAEEEEQNRRNQKDCDKQAHAKGETVEIAPLEGIAWLQRVRWIVELLWNEVRHDVLLPVGVDNAATGLKVMRKKTQGLFPSTVDYGWYAYFKA